MYVQDHAALRQPGLLAVVLGSMGPPTLGTAGFLRSRLRSGRMFGTVYLAARPKAFKQSTGRKGSGPVVCLTSPLLLHDIIHQTEHIAMG